MKQLQNCLGKVTAENSARIMAARALPMSPQLPQTLAERASRRSLLIVGSVILFAAMGCSGKPSPADHSPLAGAVRLLADAAQNSKHFQQLFAAGAAPKEKERQRYAEFMYLVTEVHPLAEAEGELRVKVLDSSGQERGEMTWTVAQEDGKWKLKSAPLP